MEVKTAFLNGDLDEEVYMKQPKGFVMPGVIICLYVDDMLIFRTDQNQVNKTKKFFSSRFSIKDMGEADVILDYSSVSTHIDLVEKLKPNTGKPVDQLEYSRAIGCLMYAITSTRPDIAYAIGKMSRWINYVEDSSSTSGWMFLLRGGAISWASKKQTCITGSTMEYSKSKITLKWEGFVGDFSVIDGHLGNDDLLETDEISCPARIRVREVWSAHSLSKYEIYQDRIAGLRRNTSGYAVITWRVMSKCRLDLLRRNTLVGSSHKVMRMRLRRKPLNSWAVVRLPDPKRKTLGEKGIDCIFVGYAEHSKAYRFYVIEPNESVSINSIIESRDAIFDENRFSSIPRPKDVIPNSVESQRDDHSDDVPSEVPEPRKRKRVRKAKSYGSDFQLYLVEGSRDQVGSQYSYCYSIEEDYNTLIFDI
ncbi:hypothetical protein Tco_1400745 [Tanacetum coccineum]